MNNRGIVIDGPDGAGKTTLAREIERIRGYKYLYRGTFSQGPAIPYFRGLGAFDRIDNRVVDRFALSDVVYGFVFRRESHITVQEYIDLVVKPANYSTVIYLPSRAVCEAACKARGEYLTKPERRACYRRWEYVSMCVMAADGGKSHLLLTRSNNTVYSLAMKVLKWYERESK